MFALLYQIASDFRRDRKAVTALEYGLIAALIAVAIIAALDGARQRPHGDVHQHRDKPSAA